MPVFYTMQYTGKFGLGLGVTYSLLNRRYGFDMGMRFHRDIQYRIKTSMDMDRAVYDDFREIGIGFVEPFPRVTIEPFGHGFIPVMYGCPCIYTAGQEPSVGKCELHEDETRALAPWTRGRFEQQEPVREILEQYRSIERLVSETRQPGRSEFNPHFQPFSSLQNLASVVNNAHSIYGEEIFYMYMDNKQRLRRLYKNISDLMLLCLDFFPRIDGRRLTHVFVGDCTVSMISPSQYMENNFEFDLRLARYSRKTGARFLVHQDSGATPHLEGFSKLGAIHAFDLGQDTDFESLYRLFPDAEVNCILFPGWLQSASLDEIRAELERIMEIGLSFRSFTFSVYHIDSRLAEGRIFDVYDIFRVCAERISDLE